jgi:hypothetical protein
MSTMLTEDHQMLIEAVRDFARRELVERDREWDRTETSCCTQLDVFYAMGLMGLRVPEDYGGLECPGVPYAHIIRELAACSASVAVTIGVHNMVAMILAKYGGDEVKAEVLPQLTQPNNLAAFAISEPNAGSDPGSATTRAEKMAGGYRLSGSKMWVTNGITGRWFAVLARTGTTGTSKDLSMLLINAEDDGVTRSPIHGKMGIRGSETAEMHLDNVFVPESRLLGQEGWGMGIGLSALDGGRIGIASQALGIGLACLEAMVEYAKQREQFRCPIAEFQAIQWMIADTKAELMATQTLIDKAAWLHESDRPFTQAASMAKLYASEAVNRIAYRAVQLHGGYGFVNEFRVEQLYRDARITTIYEGTSEVQRMVIARGLFQR